MIPRGRFVPAAGGGAVAPWVSFAGGAPGTNFLDGFGQTNSPGFTLAARLRFDETPAHLDYLIGANYNGLFHDSDTSLFGAFTTTTFQDIDFAGAPATTFAANDIICLMIALDTSAGMTGGANGLIWINGAQEASHTTAVTGNIKYNEGGNELRLFQGSDGTRNTASMSTNGVWMGTGALDPNTHWSSFFDGSNQWQNLTGDGTIGGVTPFFWQNGDATAWNSGSDNNSNSYTMNGSVT